LLKVANYRIILMQTSYEVKLIYVLTICWNDVLLFEMVVFFQAFTFPKWTNHFVESMCFMYLGFLRNTKQIVECLYGEMRDTKVKEFWIFLEIHIFYWWAILYLLFMCCNFTIEVWWYCPYQNICTLYFGFVCYYFYNVNLISVFYFLALTSWVCKESKGVFVFVFKLEGT
jgi:hypothetical protein